MEEHLELLGFEDCVEGAGVLAVAIAKGQSAATRHGGPDRRRGYELAGSPLRGGVRSDAGDAELAGAMLKERQRIQPSAGDRVHVEEVRGDDPFSLGGEELAPAAAAFLQEPEVDLAVLVVGDDLPVQLGLIRPFNALTVKIGATSNPLRRCSGAV